MTGYLMHLACLLNPDQSTPWLAYADWLDEHGTTDRDRAHSEWIRKTNAKLRKGNNRHPGEPGWISTNCHRLWPNLMRDRGGLFTMVQLPSRRVRLMVPVKCKNDRWIRSHMDIVIHRGVASSIDVPFYRSADYVADAVVDEPYVPVRFMSIRTAVRRISVGVSERWAVYSRPFHQNGMKDVWNGLEGWTEETPGRADVHQARVFSSDFHGKSVGTVAMNAVNASLTRWARGLAGVPHVVPPPVPDVPDVDGPPNMYVGGGWRDHPPPFRTGE